MKRPSRRHANLPALRRTMAVLAMAGAFPALVWGLLEVWQRPIRLSGVDDRWLIAAGIAGFLFAILAWPAGRCGGCWWKRAGLGGAVLAVFLIGVCSMGREMAVGGLMRHPDVDRARGIERPETKTLKSRMEAVREWLIYHRLPVPKKPNDLYEEPYTLFNEPLDHLLETSRWPVRREFMRRMMRDEKGAAFLVDEWHRLFPAVTGQDVALAQRNDMLKWLDALARAPSTTTASRDAATFWMALIVLSDPGAFAGWRVPVRDGMLACEHPPMTFVGDAWMRVIDVLLAFDSEEETVDLTGVFERDPRLLRRALREQVRGMEGRMPRMLDEIAREDALGSRDAPVAIWLDLKRLTDRLPDSPERTETLEALREILATWLTEDEWSVRERFKSDYGNRHTSAGDFIMEMPEEIQRRLHAHALGLLADFKPDESRTWRGSGSQATLERALLIRNFLDSDQRVILSRKLADVMEQQLWDFEPEVNKRANTRRAILFGFAGIWDDITGSQKERIGRRIRTHLDEMDWAQREVVRFLDAFSGMRFMGSSIGLVEAEWLAIAGAMGRGSRQWRFDEDFWWSPEQHLDVKRYSREAVEDVIRAYIHAATTRPESMRLREGPDALVFPKPAYARPVVRSRSKPATRHVFLIYLAAGGLAAVEEFPNDAWGAFMDNPWLVGQLVYNPNEARLSRWLDDPSETRTILALLEDPQNPWPLGRLPGYLRANPPPKPVLDAIHRHYRDRTHHEDRAIRILAFRMLMRMEEGLNPTERDALRESFRDFMERDRPSTSEWKFGPSPYEAHDEQGLISWRDDALSAEFGWHAHIAEETRMREFPMDHFPNPTPSVPVFQHLAFACNPVERDWYDEWISLPYPLDTPVPRRAWLSAPPGLPFPPTPWQRARELAQRRPDLDFPDRAPYRPSRRAFDE